MKKAPLLVALTLAVLVAHPARAQVKQGFGLGVMLGEPTGLSLKLGLSDTQALAVGLAWSMTENSSFQFQLDYLLHNFELFDAPGTENQLALYYGIGGRVRQKSNNGNSKNSGDSQVGVRLPVGITYVFRDAPVDVFGELVPILDVLPTTSFGWGAAIGTRFYF
jgi:hypothetical protein